MFIKKHRPEWVFNADICCQFDWNSPIFSEGILSPFWPLRCYPRAHYLAHCPKIGWDRKLVDLKKLGFFQQLPGWSLHFCCHLSIQKRLGDTHISSRFRGEICGGHRLDGREQFDHSGAVPEINALGGQGDICPWSAGQVETPGGPNTPSAPRQVQFFGNWRNHGRNYDLLLLYIYITKIMLTFIVLVLFYFLSWFF